MEYIKKYEGFLDLFKSGINMVSERINKFLKEKKNLKFSKLSKEGNQWSWIEEIEDFGEFNFSLLLTQNEGGSFSFNLNCQSQTDTTLKSKTDRGRWAFGKLSNFDHMLMDLLDRMIREVKVLAVCEKANKEFLEDFPLIDVEDYLIDLKDLVNGEIQISFEKAGPQYKGFIKENPSYVVSIKPVARELVEEIKRELEIIESNIKNLGLQIKGDVSKIAHRFLLLDRYDSAKFELVRNLLSGNSQT
jgi:hypothetical protein